MAPVTRSHTPSRFVVHPIAKMNPPANVPTATEYKEVTDAEDNEEIIFTSVKLEDHIKKNKTKVSEKFPGCYVDNEGFLIDPKTGQAVAASRANTYQTVHPFFYRPGYLTKAGLFDQFMENLRLALPGGGHEFSDDEINSVVDNAMPQFIGIFENPNISEKVLRIKVGWVMQKMVTLLAPKGEINLIQEVLWAAKGILCWGEKSVGFFGYADHVLYAGNQIQQALACLEYKLVNADAAGQAIRWIQISGALLGQILGAMVGLGARLGLAWTQIGFKALCQTKASGNPEFVFWPPGDEFWQPSQEPTEADREALKIVVELVAGSYFLRERNQSTPSQTPGIEEPSSPTSRPRRVLKTQLTDPSPGKKHKST